MIVVPGSTAREIYQLFCASKADSKLADRKSLEGLVSMLFPELASETAPKPILALTRPVARSIPTVRPNPMSKKDTFRIVTRGTDGSLRIRDFPSADPIFKLHSQIGVDDSSADLELRGLPVFRGLIGPIPEGKNIVRYESPEVFEVVTKEWSNTKIKRRRRRTAAPEQTTTEV